DELRGVDLHVHVPEGAVAKDGPSAGVVIAMALLSLLTRRPLRPLIALTGEITLTGAVLPVGGLREKLLAARRFGIRELVLPAGNLDDVHEDVPPALREGITLRPVREVDDAARIALGLDNGAQPEVDEWRRPSSTSA